MSAETLINTGLFCILFIAIKMKQERHYTTTNGYKSISFRVKNKEKK